MSDEVKNPETELTPEAAEQAPEQAAETAAAAADTAEQAAGQAEEAQEKELNDLRDIFQQEWNKALAESNVEPPIQALDYSRPEEEEEPEHEETPAAPEAPAAPAKEKKEKKKHGKAPLVVLIVLLVLLLIPLSLYVFVSIKAPTFNSYISAYAAGLKASDAEEKLSCFEKALSYCEEGSVLESQRQGIIEEIVLLKCDTDGYAAAASYANQNLTDEMRAAPVNKEFKAFLAAGEKIDAVADGAYDAVAAKFNAVNAAADIDYEAAATELGVPDVMRAEAIEALQHLGAALEAEKEFKNAGNGAADGFDTAMTEFLSAVQSFRNLGADGQTLLEHAAASLYNNGFVYETTVLVNNYFSEEMLANVKTESFTAVRNALDALQKADVDVYATALALFENNTVTEDDMRAALAVNLPDEQKNVLVKTGMGVLKALKAEDEKNLTEAKTLLTESLNTLEALQLDTAGAATRLIDLLLETGDGQSAYSVRENYITEEALAAADDETKELIQTVDDIYAAESAANDVFAPFYSELYYSGTPLDKEAIGKALDALLTPEADKYLTAYVSYFKYITEGFTDADEKTMIGYLNEFAKAFRDRPAFYNSMLAECYRMRGDYAEAEALADAALKVNVADDYAISLKAMAARIKGSVDEALKIAEDGVALSGEVNNCAREALICYLLKGDAEKAWGYAKTLFEDSLTLDHCEYVLLTAAIADNAPESVKSELNEYTQNVNEILTSNSVSVGEKAQGVLDGTLTMEDVFLRSPYYLR